MRNNELSLTWHHRWRAHRLSPATNEADEGGEANGAGEATDPVEAYGAAAPLAPLGSILLWPCPFFGQIPRCRVFLPDEARATHKRLTGQDVGDPDNPFWEGPSEPPQALLQAMATDPDLGFRDLPLGTETQVKEVEALVQAMPNLSGFLERVLIALKAARVTGGSPILPPTLLVGEPGTGKSRCARAVAKILGSPFREIAMPSLSGGSAVLTGFSSSWKRPRAGLIAEALVCEPSAAPIFFLDEVEKRYCLHGDDPLNALHALLEPDSARVLRDEGVETRFAAHHVIWMASANEVASLPPSLRDRFDVLHIPTPTRAQMLAIVNSLYLDVASQWGDWFDPEPPGSVTATLPPLHPRALRRLFHLACSLAASEGGRSVLPEHLSRAGQLLQVDPLKHRVGFV